MASEQDGAQYVAVWSGANIRQFRGVCLRGTGESRLLGSHLPVGALE